MPTPHKPFDLSHVSPADRIHLIQELWDSIHDDVQAVPLAAEQKAELERRHAEMESGGTDLGFGSAFDHLSGSAYVSRSKRIDKTV